MKMIKTVYYDKDVNIEQILLHLCSDLLPISNISSSCKVTSGVGIGPSKELFPEMYEI